MLRVELHHTPKNVPIKELEVLSLGVNAGHRMSDRKILMAKFSKSSDEGAASGSPMGGSPMSPMGGFGPMGGAALGAGGGGMGGGASGQTAKEETPNGISKLRYIEVTDQVRRMPVSLVLIIDQLDLQDILAAFTNSEHMRYQITQYHWKRYYPTANAAAGAGNPMGPAAPMGGGTVGPMGGGFGPMGGAALGPGGGGMAPGAGPGAGGPVVQHATEAPPANLVELTIYGVATLYEKPKDAPTPAPTPPEPKPEATTPAKPAPTTPTSPKTDPKKPAEPIKPMGDPMKPAVDPKTPASPATAPKPGEATPPKPGEATPAKSATPPPPPKAPDNKDKPK
jgi:hypothetical protein